MTDFRTYLLLHDLRAILVSVEDNHEAVEHYGSFLELKSMLRLEVDRLEKEIDRDLVDKAEPSVGVPF